MDHLDIHDLEKSVSASGRRDRDADALGRLHELEQRHLLRRLHVMDSPASAVVQRDGRQLLNFAGNNYLGLAGHPAVVAAAREAALNWGVGSGASPLVIGHQRIHAELEQALADFKGAEAALVFPTGFAANLGVISALAGRGDYIFSDRLNHASLIDGCRLSGARTRYWPHGDLGRLHALLRRCPASGSRFIVTDGVFSMDGDLAPLPDLLELTQRYAATLIIDDAHGTGVLGPSGRGTMEHFGLDHGAVVQIGTLSKALGAAGGFVCGSRALIALILNRARSYIYSTALAPPSAAAALAALRIVQSQPELCECQKNHVHRLHRELAALGLKLHGDPTAPLLAVHVGDAADALRWSACLEERGILAPAIRPPTVPAGTARIRLSPMATHDERQITRVIEAFAAVNACPPQDAATTLREAI